MLSVHVARQAAAMAHEQMPSLALVAYFQHLPCSLLERYLGNVVQRGMREMGKETGIAWTDHTFNPWWGCTKVSAGCDNCYAATFDKRVGGDHWGKGMPRRTFGIKHWNEPLGWNHQAMVDGVQRRVFCASMADVMDDEAPDGERSRLWELIDATPNLMWQLLTKRPHRFSRYLPSFFIHSNVILGTTAENQVNYDIRWPVLRNVARDKRLQSFVSYEPALSALTMSGWEGRPDWIIFGGETGAGRRPMERQWADDLLEECRLTGTKFFMKQFSASTPAKAAELIPAELLIREFPQAIA